MDLLNLHHRAKFELKSWLIENFGTLESEFNGSAFMKQCNTIAQFLGYPIEFDNDLTIAEVEEKVRDYLYIYEDLKVRYPFGVKDFLKELNKMDYNERLVHFPNLFKMDNINFSLKDSIISIENSYAFRGTIIQSLKDALIDIELIEPPLDLDKFWEDVIKDSHKFKTGELTCPF